MQNFENISLELLQVLVISKCWKIENLVRTLFCWYYKSWYTLIFNKE